MSVKLYYPATQRNREPILAALRDVLATCSRVLEIASGSGEHVEYLAPHFPRCTFVPSDIDPQCIASIEVRAGECCTGNIAEPMGLNVVTDDWPPGPFDAVLNANMIHISPWSACQGLMRGVANVLRPRGHLCLYGPFMRGGEHTAPSNAAFSDDLRRRNPDWGVRDLDDVSREAGRYGLELESVTSLPANNLMVLFRAAP